MNPLPYAVNIVVMALAAGAGLWYGVRLFARGARLEPKADARKFPLIAILGLAFVFGNTAFLVVWNRASLAWYFPVPVHYWCLPVVRALDAAIIAFIFGAVGILAFRQRLRIRWVVPVLGVVSLLASEYLIQSSLWFKPVRLGPPKEKGGIVLQSGDASCAAAACANIARHYGLDTDEEQMAEILGTSVAGTTVAQMVYGMRRFGFECRKRRVPDADFTQLQGPAILLVRFGTEELAHAVAYMGASEGKAEVWNPQGGRSLMTADQLRDTWRGHAVEVFAPEETASTHG